MCTRQKGQDYLGRCGWEICEFAVSHARKHSLPDLIVGVFATEGGEAREGVRFESRPLVACEEKTPLPSHCECDIICRAVQMVARKMREKKKSRKLGTPCPRSSLNKLEEKIQILYSRLLETCRPGVFAFPHFSISPRSFCTKNVTCGTNPLCTVQVQREMEKVEKRKLRVDTFPATRGLRVDTFYNTL
jgi:hypothetical protein